MKILFQPKYYLNFIFYLSWINLVSSEWFTILSNIYNTCLKSTIPKYCKVQREIWNDIKKFMQHKYM